MKNTVFLCLFVASATFFSNCRVSPFDDVKTDGLDQNWAIPLVDTKKSFGDIINGFDPKAFIQIGTDSSVILHYMGNFTAKSSIDLFANFRNVQFPILDSMMMLPLKLPGGVHIDTIVMKSGSLKWLINAPSEPLYVTITIPQLTKNGQIFRKTYTQTSFIVDGIDMAGWRLTSANDSLNINTIARKVSNGTPVNLTGKGGYQIQDFEFSFAKGYFGQTIFDGVQDSILIDFFDKWRGGVVQFDNPRMILTLDNSFGFPVRAVMKQGEVNTLDGRVLPLQSPLTTGVDINYPKNNEVGQTKRTIVVFDKNNSNIATLMSSNPTAIVYKVDGLTNPDPTSRVSGFMTDSSKFELQVEAEIPMVGKAKSFEVNDTFNINLVQATDITQAEFKVITDNGMPIDLSLQGYFMTDKGIIIDSMYTTKSPILRGAPVNSYGLPTSTTYTESFVTLNPEKLKKVRDAKKLIIRYSFSTTNNGAVSVKLISSQSVRVRIGVKFGLKTQ